MTGLNLSHHLSQSSLLQLKGRLITSAVSLSSNIHRSLGGTSTSMNNRVICTSSGAWRIKISPMYLGAWGVGSALNYRVFFTGPVIKDGKIPTKKIKSYFLCDAPCFHYFVRDFVIFPLLVKRYTLY